MWISLQLTHIAHSAFWTYGCVVSPPLLSHFEPLSRRTRLTGLSTLNENIDEGAGPQQPLRRSAALRCRKGVLS